MKHSDQTHHSSNTEWELLGKLKLPTGVGAQDAIRTWILKLLIPLNLSPDLLHRVIQSAQESAMRYLQPDARLTLGHIHLSIQVPKQVPAKGKPWGFFHIERIDPRAEAAVVRDHAIEFYLYAEGD